MRLNNAGKWACDRLTEDVQEQPGLDAQEQSDLEYVDFVKKKLSFQMEFEF